MSDKSEKIYEGITNIDDKIIEEAQDVSASVSTPVSTSAPTFVSGKARGIRPHSWWMSAVAAVLVMVIALGIILSFKK